MKMQLAEIAKALKITTKEDWKNVTVTSVSFDTRTLRPGALFVPLIGENDGHQFVEKAIANGAVATLWQSNHQKAAFSFPILEVNDTLAALQKLAKYYLNKINPRVIAVTGSNGKTTTKDMIAAILATSFNVKKTQENFNNQIGVPMTVLNIEPNTEVLVVEMGMDHFGELDHLSRLVSPDLAVITMIGEAHIEFFGTRDKIADAKMEITHGLKEDGILVYNGDEPLLRQRTSKLLQETRTFGGAQDNDYRATNVVSNEKQTGFRVTKWPELNFTVPMIGSYNVKNALAALAVGDYFQIPIEKMATALNNISVTANRTQWIVGSQGEMILSDVYNSNPTAAKLVLKAFSQAPTTGKRVVVLGDMLELGSASPQMHASLAQAIDPQKIAEVFLCGTQVKTLAAELVDKFSAAQLHLYDLNHQSQLIADLKNSLKAKDLVMLKGSHGIHLENVLAALR
ncbi:UDP-N-acetylmuramoyl-tripeptide--D-alanyl-D-alanine ligase [Liquorilactobacillus sicerae]|uniref:UDP-N-acetylmuramoyl-tripeptide--D-alanyl-D- alanine ligase n=1 Tax=Liquorilactobacillus sicerae TaxID=1416943 RepID=UPI00247FDC83|nr:UDP-N-acetylmuramoyl-tripeptide--D-alanyl-D-alanine ligase [Liquorilactobacillus sicerae]